MTTKTEAAAEAAMVLVALRVARLRVPGPAVVFLLQKWPAVVLGSEAASFCGRSAQYKPEAYVPFKIQSSCSLAVEPNHSQARVSLPAQTQAVVVLVSPSMVAGGLICKYGGLNNCNQIFLCSPINKHTILYANLFYLVRPLSAAEGHRHLHKSCYNRLSEFQFWILQCLQSTHGPGALHNSSCTYVRTYIHTGRHWNSRGPARLSPACCQHLQILFPRIPES